MPKKSKPHQNNPSGPHGKKINCATCSKNIRLRRYVYHSNHTHSTPL